MKEKFFAQYFEFYKTLKSNFGIQIDILTKIQLSGRNDHLEQSGEN